MDSAPGTKWYFTLNALLREFIGYLYLTRKGHAIVIGVVAGFAALAALFLSLRKRRREQVKKEKEERMRKNKYYRIEKDSRAMFHNQVDYCVGTGRMGLALQQEYQEQLRLVQSEIGFGIFGAMAFFRTIWPSIRNMKADEAGGV